MKNLLMKLLGIETTSKKLARLETNQAKLKDIIDRGQNAVGRLTALHEQCNDGPHKLAIANHIAYANSRIDYYRKQYAETQTILRIVRITHEASKGIYA
jgi:hypothetical protein